MGNFGKKVGHFGKKWTMLGKVGHVGKKWAMLQKSGPCCEKVGHAAKKKPFLKKKGPQKNFPRRRRGTCRRRSCRQQKHQQTSSWKRQPVPGVDSRSHLWQSCCCCCCCCCCCYHYCSNYLENYSNFLECETLGITLVIKVQ